MSVSAAGLRWSSKKTLLICADSCTPVEECLAAAGCIVGKVSDGGAAVNKVRREIFDIAVVVSTGSEMDLAETVFNLKDVRNSLEIVIVADKIDSSRDLVGKIAAAVSNTILLDFDELAAHVKHSGR